MIRVREDWISKTPDSEKSDGVGGGKKERDVRNRDRGLPSAQLRAAHPEGILIARFAYLKYATVIVDRTRAVWFSGWQPDRVR